MEEKLVKKIKESSVFGDLLEHISTNVNVLNSIDDIDGIDKLSNVEVGELVRARAIAMSILREILAPFFEFNEKKEPTDEEIKTRSKKFGL